MPPAPAPQRKTGVLILRAWIEDPPGGLRAHITSQLDVSQSDRQEVGARHRSEIVEIVRRWLDAFVASADGGSRRPEEGVD